MNTKKLNNFIGIDLVGIARKFETPIYLYNLNKVVENFSNLYHNIPYKNKRILFAMKSNFNYDILKTIRQLGGGIDAISIGEIEYALDVGFKKEDILFTGIGISNEDLEFCFRKGITPNVGSIDLLERIGSKYQGARISIRINPDYGAGHHDHVITGGPQSKFGIYETYLERVKEISKKYDLKIIGIHFHIGSGALDYSVYTEAIKKALDISLMFEDIEFIDIGGGIGIPYRPDQKEFDVKSFGIRITEMMEDFSSREKRDVKLFLEPGRYLVAESGVLLTRVVEIKETPLYKFVIVDTGFNHLVRPVMYGSYHEIINLSNLDGEGEEVVVAGNVCESGDIFTRDDNGIVPRLLKKARYGDIIGIFDAGAYGYAMASHYNLRKLPKEIVIRNGNIKVSKKKYLKYIIP
ncbi:MAG: diaminopimelate decarboxylase [Spirochaetia bacterium]|nr:diaminopimelate decarboxylase [Spirochaetota bacterium]MCX8097110.1 diaminopimelate decarboxylase [Spirochaetota bacterium]MDW8112120.1 diaminopimelate decarboxylase [Spirochaetia bacterium]